MSELWPKGKARDMKFGPTMFHVKHLALVLSLSLLLPLPALAEGAEEAPAWTYEQIVEKLQNRDRYVIERTFDTDLCTVFLCRAIGTPHSAYYSLTAVYKTGSPLGAGTEIRFPLQFNNEFWGTTRAPSTVDLNEDGSSLRYTYFSLELGTDVYSVDLATGEVSMSHVLPTYEEILAAHTWGWNVETTLEAPDCTAILMWSDLVGLPETETVRDYAIILVSKENTEPEEQSQRLLLPSTAAVGNPEQYPTDRAPDELFLNEDGSVLTYVYSFEDALYNLGGELLHDSGTYTYAVDTATGELSVTHRAAGWEDTGFSDVSSGDWFAPYVKICVEEGLMKGTGAGLFSPNDSVTLAQAVTLAARIHHILNGGDGKLPSAPEDWGTLTVEFENGTVLQFDSTQYHNTIVPMSSRLGASVTEEQRSALDWLGEDDRVPATVTAAFAEPVGPLPCAVYWNGPKADGRLGFRSRFEADEEEQAAFSRMHRNLTLFRRPLPGDWYRDTVYYLESVGLADRYPLRPSEPDKAATRSDYVEALSTVAEELLEPINDISDFPDSPAGYLKELVLSFYNAGILTGKDEFGTFDAGGTLTRAECAAMAARLMRPELRLKFQPTPAPEKYGYTLTYLMDDPMQGHTTTYPVLPIITSDGADNGFLTLDGELIPWPGGQEPISIYSMGNYIWCSFWVDGVEQGGLMDKTGDFVIPLQSRFYYAYPTEGGFVASTQIFSGGSHALLDSQGQVVKELDIPRDELEAYYPCLYVARWLDVRDYGNYYVDGVNHPVSEEFDWVGDITDDGRGFVGRDGKIYCIQFFEK